MPSQQEILFEQMSRQEYEEDYGDMMFGESSSSDDPTLNTNDPQQLTRVNGIGLWNSWTRNFATPLLATLDLLDNAFDAGFVGPNPRHSHHFGGQHFQGRIHITADEYQPTTDGPKMNTGLRVINNCVHKIKPLSDVLEVYKSAKGSGADSIGENGVGLKQGCATLSDLSFVLTRNGTKCSLGVISFALQKPEGCFLPSFELDHSDPEGRRQEMEFIFNVTKRDVGESVRAYGDGDLPTGINRLNAHFQTMTNDIWGKDDHVFCLIIHKLRHGGGLHDQQEPGEDWKARASNLMDSLFKELPRQYIHIPASSDVRVNNKPVPFHYWQRRLVELTRFTIKIDTHNAWKSAQDWTDPAGDNVYPIRIYCGFDALRMAQGKGAKRSMSMFVYSRQSGRLIKYSADARGELGLDASGTAFSQCLTIIVDDFNGNLPLNPTKQDIAFGEQANGETHKGNLLSWVAAIAHMYYNFHLDKFGGKKTVLTEALKRHVPAMEGLDRSWGDVRVRSLEESHFTAFRHLCWFGTYLGKIRIKRKDKIEEVPGRDTLIRLTVDDDAPLSSLRAAGSAKKWKKKKRLASETVAAMPDEVSSYFSTVIGSGDALSSSRPPRSSRRKLREIESDEEGGDGDDLQLIVAQANNVRRSPAKRTPNKPSPGTSIQSARVSLSSTTSLEAITSPVTSLLIEKLKKEAGTLVEQLAKQRKKHSDAMGDEVEKEEKLLDQLERGSEEQDELQANHEKEMVKLQRRCRALKHDLEQHTRRGNMLHEENVALKAESGPRDHQVKHGDRSKDTERLMQANKDLKRSLQLSQQRESLYRRKTELANNEKVTLEEMVNHLQSQLGEKPEAPPSDIDDHMFMQRF